MHKRRKGIFGPELGKKAVVFVDDLNMPKKETYGAQPPLELLRQYCDHKGWYNRKDLYLMKIEDLIFLSAMGPPGGGRTNITGRLTRHYNIVAYVELDEKIQMHIFNKLSTFFMKKFSEDIREMVPGLVTTVLQVYNSAKSELLPIPSKSHYTFNLRDIWRVF